MKLKSLQTLILLLAVFIGVSARNDSDPKIRYIEKYSSVAVDEMVRSGIPASITLAQGLLESAAGQSTLAVKGNNHFGIKCHNWKGKSMKHDDDRRNECFRVYDSAEQSFRDHSDFIRFRDRYKPLFETPIEDYKAWAYGLKKAGYATDPAYPEKLIKLIEDYDLTRFDKITAKQAEEIPEAPFKIEEPVKYEKSGEFRFSLSRQIYSVNGVPFVYSVEGETYSSIARSFRLFDKEILKFNDLKAPETLIPGTKVFIHAKKKQATKGMDIFVVDEDGITLRDIAQRYGVRLDAIVKLNGLSLDYVPAEGDVLKMRKTR